MTGDTWLKLKKILDIKTNELSLILNDLLDISFIQQLVFLLQLKTKIKRIISPLLIFLYIQENHFENVKKKARKLWPLATFPVVNLDIDLVTFPFYDLEVFAIRDYETYLKKLYGINWKTEGYEHFNHVKSKVKKKILVKLIDFSPSYVY